MVFSQHEHNVDSYLFAPDVGSPRAVYDRAVDPPMGVVVEVDPAGRIVGFSCTELVDLARDFVGDLVLGRSVITDRDAIEADLRLRYRAHSQRALISAMRRVYEAVDQSPLVLGHEANHLDGDKQSNKVNNCGCHAQQA